MLDKVSLIYFLITGAAIVLSLFNLISTLTVLVVLYINFVAAVGTLIVSFFINLDNNER